MAVPPPLSENKSALRRRLRAARGDFIAARDDAGRAGLEAAITRHLAPLLGQPGPFAGYVAQGDEPDIQPFLQVAHLAGRGIALPVITRTAMTFALWHPGAVLTPGYSGIPQPDVADMVEPAILLTPLLGFDRAGNRLGQGGGFYDRWFAAHPAAMRIGIAWSVQEVPALVCDPWDVPLHAIVTEKEWIAPS